MIIVRLAGGLGNQMFQYATGRRLAHVRNTELKLDLSVYGPEGDTLAPGLEAFRRKARLLSFNITAPAASNKEVVVLADPFDNSKTISRIGRRIRKIWPHFCWPDTDFREKQYRFDPAVMNLPDPSFLSGFFQSEKYFSEIRDIILREFTPRDANILPYARSYVQALRDKGLPVVSLHVRRGELAHAQNVLKSTKGVFGPPTGLEYISKAIAQFPPGSCCFLVFSDSAPDIAWCKENIKANDLYFSEGHDDIQDMMLMSSCDHHIIASTFSWWAAWLNTRADRRVVAPSKWGYAQVGMVPDDLIPPGWVTL